MSEAATAKRHEGKRREAGGKEGRQGEMVARRQQRGQRRLREPAAHLNPLHTTSNPTCATPPTPHRTTRSDARARLSPKCREEVFKAQQAAARDYRADAGLRAACEADAKKHCADVKPGGGRVQACLVRCRRRHRLPASLAWLPFGLLLLGFTCRSKDRAQRTAPPPANFPSFPPLLRPPPRQRDNHLKLEWDCGEALFRQEQEADDDVRLSVRLYARCLKDKRRFCADVPPGHAAARDCLVAKRDDEGFSEGCRCAWPRSRSRSPLSFFCLAQPSRCRRCRRAFINTPELSNGPNQTALSQNKRPLSLKTNASGPSSTR